MRNTTVLRRLLAIPGIRVVGVELTAEGLIVDVRLRQATRLRCPTCAFTTRSLYDRRPMRPWRHLDLGSRRCFLRMPVRRLVCPTHGVVTEAVPLRTGAQRVQRFEDEVASQAQHADKTTITTLLRISWRSVGRIIERWTRRHRPADALSGLARIGNDYELAKLGRDRVEVCSVICDQRNHFRLTQRTGSNPEIVRPNASLKSAVQRYAPRTLQAATLTPRRY